MNVPRPDAPLLVEETLAEVLGMWSTTTTAAALANYVCQQVDLERPRPDQPKAIAFLVQIAMALTPPDDKRMSFRERRQNAAKAAVPYHFGEALDTMMEMGWGSERMPLGEGTSVREVGEAVRRALTERAQTLAGHLLERWEQSGDVYPIDRATRGSTGP